MFKTCAKALANSGRMIVIGVSPTSSLLVNCRLRLSDFMILIVLTHKVDELFLTYFFALLIRFHRVVTPLALKMQTLTQTCC